MVLGFLGRSHISYRVLLRTETLYVMHAELTLSVLTHDHAVQCSLRNLFLIKILRTLLRYYNSHDSMCKSANKSTQMEKTRI